MTPRKRSNETNENTPSQVSRTPASSSHNHNNDPFHFINASSSPFSESFHTPLANMPTPNSLSFIDGFTPVQKKRKVARQFTAEDILNSCESRKAQDQAETERRKEVERMQLEVEGDRQRKDEEQRLNEVLKFIEGVGYPTLYSFVNALITTRDPVRSSQVSRILTIPSASVQNKSRISPARSNSSISRFLLSPTNA